MDQDFNSSPDPFGPHHDACCSLGHPMVLFGLAALVVLFVLGLMLGMRMRRTAASRDGELVLNDIYDVLRYRGVAAASATNGNVIGAASYLLHEIEDRLGPFVKIGGELKKKMGDLEKVRDEVSGANKKKEVKDEPRTVALLAATDMVMTTQAPPKPEKPSAVDMARLAVGAFNDYWGDREARMKDMRAARNALLDTKPLPPEMTGRWRSPAPSQHASADSSKEAVSGAA